MKTTFCLLALPAILHAADFHMTPTGAGTRNGSSWDNALDQKALASTVNDTMQPGDRLLLGGGTYSDPKLTIAKGGTAGSPKKIEGVDRGQGLPIFQGTWSVDAPTKGATAIRIEPGVSHVAMKGLRLKGFVIGVLAPQVKQAAERTHWVFDDVDIEQARHPFYLSDCDDLELLNCDAKRYSKHGFRFDQGCDRVTLRHCTADCSEGDPEWEKKTELFPFGFSLNDSGTPNTAFTFEDCLATNNLMPLQTTKYKNGDGFVVEGNSTGVSFLRCRAIRNQDGGYDLKVRDVQLTGCLALGNSRNFRIWNTGTLTNCLAAWGGTGLWNNGGPLTVTRSTFHALKEGVMTDDKATAPVTLKDCLISETTRSHHQTASGNIILETTTILPKGTPAGFLRPDAKWDGLGDAMNTPTGKGYQSPPSAK